MGNKKEKKSSAMSDVHGAINGHGPDMNGHGHKTDAARNIKNEPGEHVVRADDQPAAGIMKDPNDATTSLATASLDDLQSKEYREILDMVDRLRKCGLGSILPLPQLVVCGNQSSGKSSVLEAITEVPFPRKENLCTRFATEIILRRDMTESLSTKIIPDKTRPASEIKKLQDFHEPTTDFSELPALIEKATDVMGLNASVDSDDGARAFSRDVLSIEIAGPHRPQLTLVDLPGLILSANKMQTEADVKLIHSLVGDYLNEKRTIMLAVISAKDDYANQGIITKCREVDRDGHRTLGIVTKPDYLRPGSTNEQQWLDLAQNKDVYFELGGHMVKNRSEDELDSSFKARNASEDVFFSNGVYKWLPAKDKGVKSLRIKLSKLLFRHLKKELPNLQAELNTKHAKTMHELKSLGEKRSTPSEQRRFLMGVASSYQSIVTSAIQGQYQEDFFGAIDTDELFDNEDNTKRLRAAVHYLNLQFASQMRQFGHKYRIPATKDTEGTNSTTDLPEPPLSQAYEQAKILQKEMDFNDAVEWVKKMLIRTRGSELPGNSNPLLISQLFWQQSEHWEQLGLEHISLVATLCKRFVSAAIKSVTTDEIASRLKVLKLNEALDNRTESACQELRSLIADKKRQPLTYDPVYTQMIQQSRGQKALSKMTSLLEKMPAHESSDGTSTNLRVYTPDFICDHMKEVLDPDMDKLSAEDALVSQLAYYKDEVRYFIAADTKQVIERHLISNLAEDTFCPLVVNDMTDGEVAYVAAEAHEVTQKREYLESHKEILEKGQKAFREAMGSSA